MSNHGEPRSSSFEVLTILADLMNGVRHSRHTVAARADVSLVTADRWIRELLRVPGCSLSKRGKTTLIAWAAQRQSKSHEST